MAKLLDEIEAFLENHPKISATAFGDMAMNDRHLVRQLREGRRTWPETEQKVRAFMAAHASPAPAICAECEKRADDPAVAACLAVHCPLRVKEAA